MAIKSSEGRLGRRLLFAAPFAFATAATAACAQGNDIVFPRSSLVIVTGPKELKFDIEMATTEPQRERGLMYRKQLGPYEGMLFDFHEERPVSFWMKNTLIPLDLIFADKDGRVVGVVEDARPLDETSRRVGVPSRYVLEVNGGWCKKHGVGAGARLLLPDRL